MTDNFDIANVPSPNAPISAKGDLSYSSEDISRYLTSGSLDKPADSAFAPSKDESQEDEEQSEVKDPNQSEDEPLETQSEDESEEEEVINKKTFQKRLAKEVAKTKAWKERFETVTQQHQAQIEDLTSKLHQAVAVIKTVMENEDKWGQAQTEEQQKLLQYQMKENMDSHLQKMQAEYAEKVKQAQYEAKVSAIAEQIHEEVLSSVEAFPLANYHDIMHYAQMYPRTSIRTIAEKLHQRKQQVVQPKSRPPKPVNSSASYGYNYSADDIASFLKNNS